MADFIIGGQVNIDGGNAEKSVGNIKTQLREAQKELIAMADKFGATSKEAVIAAKKVAEFKDKIGDAKTLSDAFNPDAKFKGLGNALQGVAGGFAAIQGAQALFGSESKDLEKTLVKVQGAMALSQGLNSVLESKDAFKALGKQGTEAFNAIKTAIGSTGIGLLIIALGTVAVYWDDIKAAVSGVSKEQTKLLETQKKSVIASEKSFDAISKSENILKLNGKSERDILNLKIAATKQTITQLEAQLTTQKAMRQSQIDVAKRNKDILVGILEFTTAPIALLLKAVDEVGKVLGKDFGLEESLYGGIAKLVFNPEEVATEADKSITETENKLNELKNSQAGYQLQIKDINTKSSNEAKQAAKQDAADADKIKKEEEAKEKTRLENLAAQNKHTDELIEQNRLASIKDGFTKKQMELAGQEQKEIDAELDKLNNKLITQEQYELNKKNITERYGILQSELIKTEEQKRADESKKSDDERTANEKKNAEERIKAKQAETEAKIQLDNAYFDVVSGGIGIIKMFSEKNKGLQKAALIAENAIAIAKVVIAANQSVLETRAKANAIPAFIGPGIPNPAFFAAQAVAAKNIISTKLNAATSIATMIAATAKGLAGIGAGGGGGNGGGNIPGGGGGGNGGGTQAPIQAQLQTTTLNQSQIQQMGNAAVRSFVVESDVSGNQERIRRLNRAARIN
jgi:hypothetical protein